MNQYSSAMNRLIDVLKRLPGIGPKSAQRLAFYILEVTPQEVEELAQTIVDAKKSIKNCSQCFHITDKDPCEICVDDSRDKSIMCVVETPKDLMAIERSRSFKGLYHVLGGVIAPLDGVTPDALRIKELIQRADSLKISEIVLAMNPTTEGEVTAMYITKLLTPLGMKVTRIAYGLPIGGDLDYVDEATLSKSLEGRREVSDKI
ncbi:recombination protein RecR [candidate division WOR-1 bacterium RIFOXYC2_FULL_37_10]|uniref:Recombination protein RecR n=1 Tax=candidate division WOR-1 bacterium RIFOXYB2_FULL_37_13 TaxID=1802579 RepID=A0A1F4SDV1_UNCSA|nr:MAG: recombination protein RecR [candidate division WOR-1 bacterium RIFOXYA2_FULL_37_7]OGC18606.1 MAG: recombination protein RecR [candidate division WOR-1 bacterium RIFOXYB2_FULL_37_13]OGC36820.1 MAG: recombination protein RecR [candidate division WOR-1 bacterium RIFOXYC2_FULL_37_10]